MTEPGASGSAPSDVATRAHLQAVLRVRDTASLRPHPLYDQLRGPSVDTGPLQAIGKVSPISEPLLTNVDGTILDGHARWQAAIARRQLTVPCLEYDLTNDEALQVVITRHRRSEGLNAYCRIVLALGLESYFRERRLLASPEHARPSSNLTKRQHRDVRKDIAHLAGVATGNVTKVKQLMKSATPEVIERLRRGQVSIHRAWTWCSLDARNQREALWKHLYNHGTTRNIKHLVSAHASAAAPSHPTSAERSLLAGLATYDADDLIVSVVDTPGRAVVITRTCYEELQRRCGL